MEDKHSSHNEIWKERDKRISDAWKINTRHTTNMERDKRIGDAWKINTHHTTIYSRIGIKG